MRCGRMDIGEGQLERFQQIAQFGVAVAMVIVPIFHEGEFIERKTDRIRSGLGMTKSLPR